MSHRPTKLMAVSIKLGADTVAAAVKASPTCGNERVNGVRTSRYEDSNGPMLGGAQLRTLDRLAPLIARRHQYASVFRIVARPIAVRAAPERDVPKTDVLGTPKTARVTLQGYEVFLEVLGTPYPSNSFMCIYLRPRLEVEGAPPQQAKL